MAVTSFVLVVAPWVKWYQSVLYLFMNLTPKEPRQVQCLLLTLIFSWQHFKIRWHRQAMYSFGEVTTNMVVSIYWFDIQRTKVSIKLAPVIFIFLTTIENIRGCDKLCTYLGSLEDVTTNTVVPIYWFVTQGAKASIKIVAVTWIF